MLHGGTNLIKTWPQVQCGNSQSITPLESSHEALLNLSMQNLELDVQGPEIGLRTRLGTGPNLGQFGTSYKTFLLIIIQHHNNV
jgi:hypothetical protein